MNNNCLLLNLYWTNEERINSEVMDFTMSSYTSINKYFVQLRNIKFECKLMHALLYNFVLCSRTTNASWTISQRPYFFVFPKWPIPFNLNTSIHLTFPLKFPFNFPYFPNTPRLHEENNVMRPINIHTTIGPWNNKIKMKVP